MPTFWVISLLIGIIWLLMRKPKGSNGGIRIAAPAPIAQLDALEEVEIKGESYYQPALIRLFGAYTKNGIHERCSADLVFEPSNRFDGNAVRCEISGLLVGHVNKNDAPEVTTYLSKIGRPSIKVNATVAGGWMRGRNDIGLYGVTVELDSAILSPDD